MRSTALSVWVLGFIGFAGLREGTRGGSEVVNLMGFFRGGFKEGIYIYIYITQGYGSGV